MYKEKRKQITHTHTHTHTYICQSIIFLFTIIHKNSQNNHVTLKAEKQQVKGRTHLDVPKKIECHCFFYMAFIGIT